jgi:hypothetical protein
MPTGIPPQVDIEIGSVTRVETRTAPGFPAWLSANRANPLQRHLEPVLPFPVMLRQTWGLQPDVLLDPNPLKQERQQLYQQVYTYAFQRQLSKAAEPFRQGSDESVMLRRFDRFRLAVALPEDLLRPVKIPVGLLYFDFIDGFVDLFRPQ